MKRPLDMIGWARACLAAIDWRELLRRGAVLGALLGRWALVIGRWTLVLAGRLARLTGRLAWAALGAGVRGGARLVRWAIHHPRPALGAGLGASLAAALALVLAPLLWPAPASRPDLSASLNCLALNIYHEARGEPVEGKIAVGQVVMNRVADPGFPTRICDVVTQGGAWPYDRCQFSWWCDGLSDRPDNPGAWTDSRDLARRILDGLVNDPTRGALWYHAEHVTPEWQSDFVRQGKIGRHVFYVRQER
jgi:hypothetical protein